MSLHIEFPAPFTPGLPHKPSWRQDQSDRTRKHAEIAISVVPLGADMLSGGQSLLLAFAAYRGVVADYCAVAETVDLDELAKLGTLFLQALYVPEDVEVDIICSHVPADDVAEAIMKNSRWTNVLPSVDVALRMSFEQTSRKIGRQVSAAAAYTDVRVQHGLQCLEARQSFLHAMADQVISRFHRHPWPGLKAYNQRLIRKPTRRAMAS